MFKKKSIVLSSLNKNSNEKAVLTLQEGKDGVDGNLRLYNFTHNLNGISSLGFYVGNKVYKAGLTLKNNMLYQFFISFKEIPSKFSCAVVNFQNAEATPILYGSSEGSKDDIYANIVQQLKEDGSLKHTQEVLDKYQVDFDENEKEIIEKEIDKELCIDCENCIYKKFFFENSQKNDEKSEKNEEKIEKNDEKTEIFEENASKEDFEIKVEENIETTVAKFMGEQNLENFEQESDEQGDFFFQKLKPQIDKLFADNPLEENLQNLIPSSKWVKVDYEDDGDFYVFGLLYDEEGNVKYVCYGVPAVFEQQPPKELAGYPIWLPVGDRKDGFGYWLTYQDATTGEPVKAIID